MKKTITLERLKKELYSANEAVEDLNAGSSYDEIQTELEDADYESFCKQLSFLVKNKDPKSQALYDTFKKGWKDEYRDITVSEKFISIRDLHPTQNVIFANKSLVPMLNGKWQIGGKSAVEVVMSNKSVNVPLGDPLVVCNVGGTNYLIDGHHRWSKFYAFNPTCNLQAYIIEDKSGKGLFASSDDVLKFAQGTLAALGQDTINPQGNTDINMYDLANGGEEGGLKWMLDTVNKNITPEVLQIAMNSNLGKINGITDNATLARYLWQNLYTNMFEYAPAGVHDREYMPQYPSGMDPETAVDTISENMKFTLTVGQLRKLVKEARKPSSKDFENAPDEYTPKQIQIFNKAIKEWGDIEYDDTDDKNYIIKFYPRSSGFAMVRFGKKPYLWLHEENVIYTDTVEGVWEPTVDGEWRCSSQDTYPYHMIRPYFPSCFINAVNKIGFILVKNHDKVEKIPAEEFVKWAKGEQSGMSFATSSPNITSSGGINGGTDVDFSWSMGEGCWIKVSSWDLGFVSYT